MEKKKFSIKDTFGIQCDPKLTVEGFAKPSDFTPKTDPDYCFRSDLLSDILLWHKSADGDTLYLGGPSGAGKTSIILQIAARLNQPVQITNGHASLDVVDLHGMRTVIDGTVLFMPGPLVTAYQEGHWLLINELDLLDPGMVAGLNDVAEGNPLTILEDGGRVIHPHPDFRLIVTCNTMGQGDNLGGHAGTQSQNHSFLDRCYFLQVGYPDVETERRILDKAAPSLANVTIGNLDMRDQLIELANDVREAYLGDSRKITGQVEIPFSTRSLVRCARYVTRYAYLAKAKDPKQRRSPILHALDRALLFRAQPETRAAIQELVVQKGLVSKNDPAYSGAAA